MATQRPLPYHFPLTPSPTLGLVATRPEANFLAALAAKHGDRLEAMTQTQARAHAQEALDSQDWIALAAISMAMAEI